MKSKSKFSQMGFEIVFSVVFVFNIFSKIEIFKDT